MGNLFYNKKVKDKDMKPYVSFPVAIDNFVSGGDLIFIEEMEFFDGYTKMNTQTLHRFKSSLRLKQDLDHPDNVRQWSRIGIIVDSPDIEEIKYVLELTRDGFIKTEYMSRILELKANEQTFAIKRLRHPLTNKKARQLRKICDFLSENFGPNSGDGNYEKLW